MLADDTYNTFSDEQLMLLYQRSRDRSLFEVIYNRYFQILCKYIAWISGPETPAQDMAQNILVKLYKHPELFDHQKNLKVWLFVSAKNKIKNEKRDIARRAMHHEQIKAQTTSVETPSEYKSQINKLQRIREAINALSESHAEVMILKYSSNLTVTEIGQALDISTGTVKSRLFYGLKKIREQLNVKIESHE